MIKIKKQEFVKFLSLLNEMRSSYSASQIDNAGEEDNTPIDKTIITKLLNDAIHP